MVGASFLVDPAVSVRTESKASKINVKQFFLYCFFPGIYRMCLVVSHSKMFCLWMSLPETGLKGQYFGMRRSHQWCMGFLHWKWRFKGHNKVMALNTYKWAYSYLTLVIGVICPFVTVNGHSYKLSWMICNVTTQVTTSQIPSEGSKWVRSPSRHNSTNSLDWGSVTYKSGGPGAISCRCLTYKILKFPPHSTTSRCQ